MPTTLTPADFVNRFNAVVAGPITGGSPAVISSAAPANSSTTTMPVIPFGGNWIRNFYDVGSPAEPVFTAGMIPAFNGEGAIIAAFHILHRFAMQLTRIRIARHFYTFGTFDINEAASRRTALSPGLELYFAPPPVPIAGSNITMAELNNFVAALFNEVNARRNNAAFAHLTLSSCHNSCHSSCHGSRGRR
jgi:hypothetical protein